MWTLRPSPEAVDRLASQRVHAQANAHSATGSARNCWLCPRPVFILSCAGLRLDHRIPGAGRAESRRNRGLCKCPSNTSDASPASSNCRVICVAEVPGGVGAGETRQTREGRGAKQSRRSCAVAKGRVKYRMLHIPGILDCTYHLHVSCLCAQGSSIAEYLDYSP